MPDQLRVYVGRYLRLFHCQAKRLARTMQVRWRMAQRRWHGPTVVVMVADRTRRRALEREVRHGLRRLTDALPGGHLSHLTVVVQHAIVTDYPFAGCYHIGQDANGSDFALVRLALTVNGRVLTIDEMLAVLAEQYVGLTLQQSGGMSVAVPIEVDLVSPTHVSLPPLRDDPLSPSPNGHLPHPNQPTSSWIRKE